jgi:hypothetical protein
LNFLGGLLNFLGGHLHFLAGVCACFFDDHQFPFQSDACVHSFQKSAPVAAKGRAIFSMQERRGGSANSFSIFPHFVDDKDPDAAVDVNGWNAYLEMWLVQVQQDCHLHYLMATQTEIHLKRAKWICLIFFVWLISGAAVVVTIVALTVDSAGSVIWLPIFNVCASALSATVLTIYEAIDVNEWMSQCRQVAARFITIGRNIETLKRVPRSQRETNGIVFTREVGEQFEDLRAAMPTVLWYIRKRHTRTPTAKDDDDAAEAEIAPEVSADNKLVSLHASQVQARKASLQSLPSDESLHTAANRSFSLQQLFNERLERQRQEQEERDELAQYEAYVRNQYGLKQ